LEKGKRKGISALVGQGDFWPSQTQRARARAPAKLRPKAGDGAGARGEDAVAVGPHASESGGGGERRHGLTAGRTGHSRGRNPAAGGPVLGQWVVALARGGSSKPRGGLNLARGVREGAVRGEVVESAVSSGRGIGVGE
jgi:hypothetical protein